MNNKVQIKFKLNKKHHVIDKLLITHNQYINVIRFYEKVPPDRTKCRDNYTKIKSTLYKSFFNSNKIFKVVPGKTSFFVIGPCVLSILFVLILASDTAVLYGIVFSILVLSTEIRYSSFLKMVFVFQKFFMKLKVLKTFQVSSDFHIKICRSLKRRAVLKLPSTVF